MRVEVKSNNKIYIFSFFILVSIATPFTAWATDRLSKAQNTSQDIFPIISYNEKKHDTSLPLIQMQSEGNIISAYLNLEQKKHDGLKKFDSNQRQDITLQLQPGPASTLTQLLNFSGISSSFVNRSVPDANGAVGDTQYIQQVNGALAIYDKTSGNLKYGPIHISTLWQGFGEPCESDTSGDPIVQYDKIAHRWVITQIARAREGWFKYQCIAVSTSSDALSSYHRYVFDMDSPDYSKLGIWPDGYYLGLNGGPNSTGTPYNKEMPYVPPVNICALDRAKMLDGQPATMQCANVYTSLDYISNPLPADFDGNPPPIGTPNYFAIMDFDKNIMRFYPFHVDWNDAKKSSISGPILVPVAPFKPFLCEGDAHDGDDSGPSNCISQPNTSTKLDTLTDFLMNRLTYRYFNDGTAAMVVNHTVVTKNKTAGIRWYEFKIDQNQKISIRQENTFTPDLISRWNGSMAMDKMGNIALGYSVSSGTVFPSVRVTGREVNESLGQLQDEKLIANGNASSSYSRFGDYSAMTIDPIDDCTFWYTGEYIVNKGDTASKSNWSTVIAAFKFPNCK